MVRMTIFQHICGREQNRRKQFRAGPPRKMVWKGRIKRRREEGTIPKHLSRYGRDEKPDM